MTNKLSIVAAGVILLLLGCVKNQSPNGSPTTLAAQAQAFFEKNVAGAGKTFITSNYRANHYMVSFLLILLNLLWSVVIAYFQLRNGGSGQCEA